MSEQSIKKNFAYSSVLTISSYLFPLITFPYVTRVLGVANIGLCNFIDSVIQYFILFSMMGIGTVAIREVASVRNDKQALSRVFSSLLCLNLMMTFIALLVLFILSYTIPQFAEHQEMMFIGAGKVLFNTLLIEWFYKGLENFKYITIRTIIVRMLYAVAVFIFVQTPDDYLVYFTLNVLMVVGNAVVNFIHSKKYASINLTNVAILHYFKPFIILGVYNLLTSMYTSFNTTYLGFVSGDIEVGYYTTAVKVYTIVIAAFTAFTGVMMPRLSALLSEGKKEEFIRLTNKSIDLLLSAIMPVLVVLLCFADSIISIIAGSGYEGAVTPLRIIVPLLFISGYEQIIVIQMLMPLRKDRAIFINSIFGALIAIILNIILIPYLKSVGTSIVWVSSELTVLISAQYFINKYVKFSFPWKKLVIRIFWAMPIIAICFLISSIVSNYVLALLIGSVFLLLYYFVLEYFYYRNEYVLLGVDYIKKKFN